MQHQQFGGSDGEETETVQEIQAGVLNAPSPLANHQQYPVFAAKLSAEAYQLERIGG